MILAFALVVLILKSHWRKGVITYYTGYHDENSNVINRLAWWIVFSEKETQKNRFR